MNSILVAAVTLALIAGTRGQAEQIQRLESQQLAGGVSSQVQADTNIQKLDNTLANVQGGLNNKVAANQLENVAVADQVAKKELLNDGHYLDLQNIEGFNVITEHNSAFDTGLQFYDKQAASDAIQYDVNDAVNLNTGNQFQFANNIAKNQALDVNSLNQLNAIDQEFLNGQFANQHALAASDIFQNANNNFLNYGLNNGIQGATAAQEFGFLGNLGGNFFGKNVFGRRK